MGHSGDRRCLEPPVLSTFLFGLVTIRPGPALESNITRPE